REEAAVGVRREVGEAAGGSVAPGTHDQLRAPPPPAPVVICALTRPESDDRSAHEGLWPLQPYLERFDGVVDPADLSAGPEARDLRGVRAAFAAPWSRGRTPDDVVLLFRAVRGGREGAAAEIYCQVLVCTLPPP